MSAQPTIVRARLQPSQHTVELRRRVECLEFARRDALACGDTVEADLLDKQLRKAGAEWAASFAADHAESYRKTA